MTGDRAVSTVVGTVVVLGLLVTAMSLYQLNVVPGIKEDAEAQHMDAVARSMAQLDADLLRQLEREAGAPTTSPVPLSAETPAFVPDPSASGALTFRSADHEATVASPSLKIVTRNGTPVFASGADGSGSDWQPVQDGDTISDIEAVIGLRVKVTDASPEDGDRLVVRATDADGDFAGEFRVTTQINQPDLDLVIETLAPPAPGERIFHNHIISITQSRWDADYWIDATLDLYWFDLMLEEADKPAELTFLDEGLAAEYKISYEERADEDLSTIVGAGVTHEGYERAFATGTLAYEADNEHYPDQTLGVEHGALVRSQTEGATFVVDPPLSADAGGGVVRIGLDEPSLAGDTDTISGSGVGSVRTATTSTRALGATAGQLNLTFGTDHPTTWARFLEDELLDAGLTSSECPPSSASSPCQFEVLAGSEEVQLKVHGPTASDPDPSDPTRDVFLAFQQAEIRTEVSK